MYFFVCLSVCWCLFAEPGEMKFHSAVHSLLYGLSDNKVHLTLTFISLLFFINIVEYLLNSSFGVSTCM